MTVTLRSGEPVTVNVPLGERAYDIVIGRGLLASFGKRLVKLGRRCVPRSSPILR